MRHSPKRLVAVAALLVAVAVVAVVALGSDGRYRVTAVFDQAFGLVPSGEVKAGGVAVGEIEEIELGDDGLPRVTMAIDEDFRLREGARAELRLFSLVGQLNRYVMLEQGGGAELDDGATILAERTTQPVEFDDLLRTLTPRMRRDVGTALSNIRRATDRRGPDLAATLEHSADALGETASLLDDVAADGAALRGLVSDGRSVLGALATDPGELQGTADGLADVLDTTAAREVELAAALELLPPGLASMRGAFAKLDAEVGDLRELVAVARPAIAELVPFSRELRPTLTAARPALAEASTLVRALPADLRALRPLLREATPIAIQLDSALDLLNPVLDHVRVRAPELVSFLSLVGDANASYDAGGHAFRVAPIVNDVAEQPVESSESGPGCLVRPFDRDPGVLEGVPWTDYAESFVGGGEPVERLFDEGSGGPASAGAC